MKKVSTDSKGRVRVSTVVSGKSMTQQQFKDVSDVNHIMRRYQQTGEITHLARSQGVYADVSRIKDYHSALQTVLDANAAFMTLPADVRNRFSNDPGQFISWLQDSKNLDEAVSLGLLERKDKGGSKSGNVSSDSGIKSPDDSPPSSSKAPDAKVGGAQG